MSAMLAGVLERPRTEVSVKAGAKDVSASQPAATGTTNHTEEQGT